MMSDEEMEEIFAEMADELGEGDGMAMMPRVCHWVKVRQVLEFARDIARERGIYRQLLEREMARNARLLREIR